MNRLRVACIFAALILAPLAAVFFFPERLLEEIRPWLERVVSDRLETRVRIGRLTMSSLGSGRLLVENLRVEEDDLFNLEISRLEATFTLFGLAARRLETVRLEEPELTVFWPTEPGEPLPERPPLSIGRLEVTGGRVKVERNGDLFRLQEVAWVGDLDTVSRFRLSTRIGEGEGIVLAAAGTVSWGATPAITVAEAAWDGRPLLAAPLSVRLPAGRVDGTLRLDRFDDVQLDTLLTALQLQSPLPGGWSFALQTPELRFQFGERHLQAHLSVSQAVIGPPEMPKLELEEVTAELAGWSDWQGEGTFRLAGAPGRLEVRLAGESLAGTLSLAAADPVPLKRQLLGGDLPPLAGRLDLEAQFAREDGTLKIAATAHGRPGESAEAVLDLTHLTAEVTAKQSAGGDFSAEGKMYLRGRDLARFHATADRLRAELHPLSGRDLRLLLPESLHSFLPAGSERIAGQGELMRDSAGNWEGDIRLQAARLPFPAIEVRDIDLHSPVTFAAATVLGPALLQARLQKGEASARLRAEGTGRLATEGFSLRLRRFVLTEAEYLAADGLSGLAGGTMEGSGEIAGRPGEAGLQVDLSAVLGAREVLHGPFYADLSSMPVDLKVRTLFEPDAGQLRETRIAVEVPGLGRADLQGEGDPTAGTVRGTLTISDLGAAWAGPLGRAAAALRPELAGLQAAGALEADLRFRRRGREWRLAAEARPQGVDLRGPDNRFLVRGLGGRIPFDLRASGMPAGKKTRRGEAHVDELRLGPAAAANFDLHFAATPNRLAIESPLLFAMADGLVEVAEAEVARTPAGTAAAARVRLSEVELAALTRQLGWIEMDGRVSADLGRIRYAGGTLIAEGGMEVAAFGGEIRIGGLRLDSILSDYATLQADVEFTGLDLHQFTRTFEFGEINGIADGHVLGLRLFGRVPSAFEAVLETRESGRRNISVRALNNLSVLSQGGFSSILSRGLYRFIDFYRYRKIGIACSLHNDVFTLRGTAREDSDRYLVHGGLLPPKIDIVAASHTISFKEMLRRLQRIERTEAPATAAGN